MSGKSESTGASSRRQFLTRSAGALSLGAWAGVAAACGGGSASSDSGRASTTAAGHQGFSGAAGGMTAASSGGTGGALPAYVAYAEIKPDLAAPRPGFMDAFFHYPTDPKWAIDTPPGRGGTVSALVPVITSQLLNPDKNQHWQAVNKRLGVTLEVNGNNGSAYTDMIATRIAGGDLPDVTELTSVPDLPKVLSAKFADLTDYLAGDAVKEYPMLASLPAEGWETVMFDGRICGVPAVYTSTPYNILCRTDMFSRAGVEPKFSNADDFMKACKALSNVKNHTWAWGQDPPSFVSFIQMMLDVPNNWQLSDGKFTSMWESPQSKQAVGFVADMWKAGVVQPDSIASPTEYPTWFAGGQIAMTTASTGAWFSEMNSLTTQGLPSSTAFGILLPKFDGGGTATYWMNPISLGINAVKKAAPDRIKEVLGVLNWLATPFGTAEYLLKVFGVAGRNYTLDGSDPIPVANLQQQEVMNFLKYYLPSAPQVLYIPGAVDAVKQQHALEAAQAPTAVQNPAGSLFSNTNLRVGPKLSKAMHDGINDIVAGRKPLSSWDALVTQWKSQGGDTIAQEYAATYASGR